MKTFIAARQNIVVLRRDGSYWENLVLSSNRKTGHQLFVDRVTCERIRDVENRSIEKDKI